LVRFKSKMSLKERILEILVNAPSEVSGEVLAKELCVSRTAVWKAIQKLKKEGFEIQTTKKGYFLRYKDLLLPSRLNELVSKLILWEKVVYKFEVSSTMDVAKELAERGDKAIVVAEKQSAGRGRLSRAWKSDLGGLWITLILLDKRPLKSALGFPFLSALAVANALKETYNLSPTLKWPNDVLLSEKKVAGILLEVKGEADLMDYALIGIGVNLNNKVSQEPFEQKAISVSEYLGKEVDRFAFLSSLLQNFEALYLSLSMQEILREWKSLSSTLGRPVKVRTLNESFKGVALDLDDDGALLVQTETGIRKVYSGDCFYLR